MNYKYEIEKLQAEVKNLQDTVMQMAVNRSPEVAAREAASTGTEKNSADIDYIMMMEDL